MRERDLEVERVPGHARRPSLGRRARVRRVGGLTKRLSRWCVVGLCAAGASCADRLGLSDAGGGGGVVAPEPLPSSHPIVGLVGAVASDARLRVDWRARGELPAGLELALFVSLDREQVFDAEPRELDVTDEHAVVNTLTASGEHFVALGVRTRAEDQFVASGPVLTVLADLPIYVDPTLSSGGDGTTPATATNDLALGIFLAFVEGGGNVWVAGGDVANAALPLFTGVHVSGGFEPGFEIEQRAPDVILTRLVGADQEIARVQRGLGGTCVLDGFHLVGNATVAAGVDVPGFATELRGLTIESCQRAIKVRGLDSGPKVKIVLAGVDVSGATAQGLSVDGPFDVVVDGSTFDACGSEGADLNHLVAPDGALAALVLRGSRFTRNGAEGLDVHLGAPLSGGTLGGRFVVDVVDCDFESNALDGLRVDVDYETQPLWSAEIAVRGSRARANGLAGVHFDLDFESTAIAERLACTANGTDGFQLTSESWPGTCTLSAALCASNRGFGARASAGNVGLLASHCIFLGNSSGGLESALVRSSVHSSIACLQPAPWSGVDVRSCVIADGPATQTFLAAPDEVGVAIAISDAQLTLATTPSSAAGAGVEGADDGVPRSASELVGATVVLDDATALPTPPFSIAFFAPGSPVAEDWRLAGNSLALGAGLGVPTSPGPDAGVFGSPHGGVPGRGDAVDTPIFRVDRTTPAWSTGFASGSSITLAFTGGALDFGSLANGVFVLDAFGTSVPIDVTFDGDELVVEPPIGGWQPGHTLVLLRSLRSTSGEALVPVSIPWTAR